MHNMVQNNQVWSSRNRLTDFWKLHLLAGTKGRLSLKQEVQSNAKTTFIAA